MFSKVIVTGLICGCAGLAILYWSSKTPNTGEIDVGTLTQPPADRLPAEIHIDSVPVGFGELPESPVDNPLTRAKVQLGRKLFFDPILSDNGTVSCASCHQPEFGFASPDSLAVGMNGRKSRRNAPTLINRGYGSHFSWDGRDRSLEEQILGPLLNESEMASDVSAVIEKLQADKKYVELFRAAFDNGSGSESIDDLVCEQNLLFAIACFERRLLSGNSPVDRFRNGEYDALSPAARQGLWIFESRGGCWKCHVGPNFTDEAFHNTGVGWESLERDTGRFGFSNDPNEKYRFKTPTLREIERTAPYMHDGSLESLHEVVEFYNRGGERNDPDLDADMKPLNLNEEEVIALVEFLRSLSGDGF